jgi:DnaK suppressor protein
MTPETYRSRIEREIAELRALSDGNRDGRAPVELDQQSVGRLSRMDAMQQQSMDIAREERRKTRLAILVAALRRLDEDDFGYPGRAAGIRSGCNPLFRLSDKKIDQ